MSTQPFLPEELLDHIIQCLDVPSPLPSEDAPFTQSDNLHTLARLSRVSKQFQRLAEPVLYRTFPGHRNANAVQWLSAVLDRPERAQHVQHITVHEFVRDRIADHAFRLWRSEIGQPPNTALWRSEKEEYEYERYLLGEDAEDNLTDREIAIARANKDSGKLNGRHIPMLQRMIDASPENRRSCQICNVVNTALVVSQNRGDTSIDLVMTLIALACPNLQSMDIAICDGFDNALFAVALSVLGKGGAMDRLNLYREGRFHSQRGLGSLAMMIQKQNVKVLKATKDNLEQFNVAWTTWPNMSSMCLQDCKSSPKAMATLLPMCPALSSLELRSTTGAELEYLDDFGSLLRKHSQSLRRLVIDAGSSWYDCQGKLGSLLRRGAIGGVGSLKELTQLKALEATPWTLLFGLKDVVHLVDLLPRNLRTLTVLPCLTSALKIDAEEEIRLLKLDPSFSHLTITSK